MVTNKLKTSKQIERHFKGVANHRRIAMMGKETLIDLY